MAKPDFAALGFEFELLFTKTPVYISYETYRGELLIAAAVDAQLPQERAQLLEECVALAPNVEAARMAGPLLRVMFIGGASKTPALALPPR